MLNCIKNIHETNAFTRSLRADKKKSNKKSLKYFVDYIAGILYSSYFQKSNIEQCKNPLKTTML